MPANEFKMQPEELRELHAHAAAVGEHDVHLGRFLTLLVHHLGHAHELDVAQMDNAADEQEEAPADNEETVTEPPVKGKGK